MGKPLPPRIIRSGPYVPTTSRSGDDSGAIFQKSNLITRSRGSRFWEEVYSGEGDLDEDLDAVQITGTLTLQQDNTTVSGIGTLFTDELHLGQRICAIPGDNSNSWLLVVRRIIDDTHMIVWQAPDGSGAHLLGWRMPRLYAVNDQRGTSLTGNVQKLDKGSFLGVGSGVFRLDGQPLAGTSLTLTRHPQIALYDATTNTYTVFPLGMATPDAPTLTNDASGTKGMQAGNYSIVVTPNRLETGGYNNPSLRADVTINTGDRIAVDFSAVAPDPAGGRNGFGIWVTTFADTLGADLNYLNGPWHFYIVVSQAEIDAAPGNIIYIEYLDAEVETNEIVSFDNDAPTDAEFVEEMNAIPVYISCQGQGNVVHPDATSPGPFIVPAKPNNIEAAPLSLAFSSSPPETILGAVMAQGRIYLLTINKLQIAQSTPSDAVPIIIRPFWHDGFANPDQLVFVNGTLYGFPVAGPSRSVGDGDEIVAERDWAEDVAEIILGDRTANSPGWNPGQVLVGYDPINDLVAFIHSADSRNAAGFWTTRILGFGISQNFWVTDIAISSDVQDTIVSGVATVGDSMELLIGGRVA